MATTPRIPAELLEGYFIQMERDEANDNPVAAIAIPIELSRLAGIPIRTKRSFQLDPVLHELIRLYNAKVQDCQYCQNARQGSLYGVSKHLGGKQYGNDNANVDF